MDGNGQYRFQQQSEITYIPIELVNEAIVNHVLDQNLFVDIAYKTGEIVLPVVSNVAGKWGAGLMLKRGAIVTAKVLAKLTPTVTVALGVYAVAQYMKAIEDAILQESIKKALPKAEEKGTGIIIVEATMKSNISSTIPVDTSPIAYELEEYMAHLNMMSEGGWR